MGHCKCFGMKMIGIGALLAVNDRGWAWTPLSAWFLIGLILTVLGALKMVWPCCPIHGGTKTGTVAMPIKKPSFGIKKK